MSTVLLALAWLVASDTPAGASCSAARAQTVERCPGPWTGDPIVCNYDIALGEDRGFWYYVFSDAPRFGECEMRSMVLVLANYDYNVPTLSLGVVVYSGALKTGVRVGMLGLRRCVKLLRAGRDEDALACTERLMHAAPNWQVLP